MIDFSKFNLQELRAIGEVMDDLARNEMKLESWQFDCYVRSIAREAFRAESAAIDQQAAELTVYAIPRKPIKIDPQSLKKFEELYNEHAGDPPAAADPPDPPDMFGWVGDALDDLCAAGRCSELMRGPTNELLF